ncbi:MAG: cytochrome c [Archaeoglobaceae archaeon]
MERGTQYVILGVVIGVAVGLILASIFLGPYFYGPRADYYGPTGQNGPMGGPMMGWQTDGRYSDYGDGMYYGDGRYYPPGCCQGPENFSSNGESIYYTGINLQGERIPFNSGPTWLYQHGGSCVNCHGRNGEGGITPMMCNVRTPDITYSAMTGGEHDHKFTDQQIKDAITRGLDHDGEQLDWCMPRWQMSNEDLTDTVDYLKVLG